MNQNQMKDHNEIEIDLGRILRTVMNKAWLVALISVVCAAAVFVGTVLFVAPKYESTAMFYVNNSSSLSMSDASFSITSGDLSTSRNLVDSYIVILNTRETMDRVQAQAQTSYSYRELEEMISAGAVNETEIFKVTVTSEDPAEADRIADAIADILPDRIGEIIKGASAEVVDQAAIATKPSSPSYVKNLVLGFLLGFAASVGLIVLQEIFDTAIRTDEDIAEVCSYPILASVPDLLTKSKGTYASAYARSAAKSASAAAQINGLLGRNVSFAASEAYKLLRTKLQFSFADGAPSHVIGVCSSLSGEGKSLTSINLAYTLSQLGKKVILVDCDMRRPSLAKKLGIQKKPGLSSYLSGQSKLAELVQNCGFPREERAFHVITSGENPPNPVELLSSARMERVLEMLKNAYDYVILDLPPVGEVSDAMAIAKQTDGILLVVRQDACDRGMLSDTVRQFEFIEARILGMVFNCVHESGGKSYYKNGSYKKYGQRYGKDAEKRSVNAQTFVIESVDLIEEE